MSARFGVFDRTSGAPIIVNTRTGATLASSVEIADTRALRNKGLLGRDHLDAGHALVIVPCFSVHMFGMRFAIDVVYVDREGKVLKVVPNLRRGQISARFGAWAVIELGAGSLDVAPVQRGDPLTLAVASSTR